MQVWSTDKLGVSDRFDFWREMRAKTLFGVTAELDASQRNQFRGSLKVRTFGKAAIVEMRASPYRVARTGSDIARAPSDSLCIYQQITGGGLFDTQASNFAVASGALATSHSDMPYRTQPTGSDGYHLRILKIPFDLCQPIRRSSNLSPLPLEQRSGIAALLSAYYIAFMAEADSLDTSAAATAISALAHLALLARGVMLEGPEIDRASIRAARLSAARRLIDRNFRRQDLSPELVASVLGISIRHLHILFEPTGMTFSRHVAQRRADEALRQLRVSPHLHVADVAFNCGFESLATFYRAFRKIHGLTPGDIRSGQTVPLPVSSVETEV